jgi:hypothetical protein
VIEKGNDTQHRQTVIDTQGWRTVIGTVVKGGSDTQ